MKDLIKFLVFPLGMIGILFGSARRWDLPWFWAYMGLFVIYVIVMGLLVVDPGLRQERLRPGPGGQDRQMRWLALPLFLAHLVIAGLDVGRMDRPDTMPLFAQIAGLAGMAAALGLMGWAVGVNRFFSPVIRIQRERGHHLVTGGPYRYVRHPGYLAGLVLGLCSPLVLGSWWALAPIVPFLVLMLRRTVLEDRFLKQELAGYADYAQRVRYRLAPGIW